MRISPLIKIPKGRYSVKSMISTAEDLELFKSSNSPNKGNVCTETNLRNMIVRRKPSPMAVEWRIEEYNWSIVKTKQGFIIYTWN